MTRTELTRLVTLAQSGDKSALEQIYLYTRNTVIKKAYNETKSMDDAEDILQSCYLTIVDKISTLDNPESFEKWFNVLIANKIKDYKKKKSPILLDENSYNALNSEAEPCSDYIPHESLEKQDIYEAVHLLVADLDDKKRQSIEMHYFEEKSISEIAEELNISENTVKSRLHHGRKKLKTLLAILIIITILIITLMSVTGTREFFSKMLYNFKEEFIGFTGDTRTVEDYPQTIEKFYTASYIPDGFELTEKPTKEESAELLVYFERYQKGNLQILFQQNLLDSNGSIDNKDSEHETIFVNNNEILKIKNKLLDVYYWDNGEYILSLSISHGAISYDEEIKIIEGITINTQ